MSVWIGIIGMIVCVVMVGILGSVLTAAVVRDIDEMKHPWKYDKWMHKRKRRQGHGG